MFQNLYTFCRNFSAICSELRTFPTMTTVDTQRFSCLLNERSNVRAKNLQSVLAKLSQTRDDGAEKLCVMADFDFTLTKRWSDEEKTVACPSTYDVVKRSDLIEKSLSEAMTVSFGLC